MIETTGPPLGDRVAWRDAQSKVAGHRGDDDSGDPAAIDPVGLHDDDRSMLWAEGLRETPSRFASLHLHVFSKYLQLKNHSTGGFRLSVLDFVQAVTPSSQWRPKNA
jgi:hypothetical protein